MNQTLPAQEEIAALLPLYTETGDCTTIVTRNGQTTVCALRLRSVVSRLAQSRATDLVALKRHCAKTTKRTLLQPLPLSPQLLLVPVKVRTPRIPGDTCTGYINFHSISQVSPGPGKGTGALITLANGQAVQTLWSSETVNRQLQLARLAALEAPTASPAFLRETSAGYEPELLRVVQKLTEVVQEIVLLRENPPRQLR